MRAGLLTLGTMVGIGVCSQAFAQKIPNVQANRQSTVTFNLDAVYDTNVARTNETLAAARKIVPEDWTLRPSAHFDVVQPIGRQAVFLQGAAGYDFHKENKQLNRQNVDLTGGGVATVGPCRTTLFGKYAAFQSDLADVTLGTIANEVRTTAEGLSENCTSRGFGLQLGGRHEDVSNSAATQRGADHTIDNGDITLTYFRQGLGSVGLTGTYSQQRYPNRITFDGHVGDEYWDQMLGVNYDRQFGSKFNVSATVGLQSVKRQSAPPGIPLSSSTTNYSAALNYRVSNRLRLSVHSSRAYLPSNRPGKLYDLATTTEGVADYDIGTRISVSLGGILTDILSNTDTAPLATQLTPTKQHKTAEFASLRYRQNQHASLILDVRHEDRTTDIPSFDYTDTRATLSLAVTF